ncbi:hypothetical protein ABZ897_16190 [Nonomuraea sp. NPDC046802]|uniref:hypothetical protein n=1 Tax=Nonomuraea sp. NPDC046802 TaxID=3154919 RepID=UPI0033D5D291
MTYTSTPTPPLTPQDSSRYGHLADHIDIQRIGTGWRLAIDGQQFPYYLKSEAVIPIPFKETPRLRISLLADDVEVDFSTGNPSDPGADAVPEDKRWIERHPSDYATRMTTPDSWAAQMRALRGLGDDGLELARLAQVRRFRGGGWQLWIDGVLFPYLLGTSAEIDVSNIARPNVTFDILARRLTAEIALAAPDAA